MKKELQDWEKRHWSNVFEELKEARISIVRENIGEIIKHMSFDLRSKRNPERCTLYLTGISCHPEVKDLNCLLCACPQYDSTVEEGGCRINSGRGFSYTSVYNPSTHIWDCSKCAAYHRPDSIKLFLEKNIDKLRVMSENLQ